METQKDEAAAPAAAEEVTNDQAAAAASVEGSGDPSVEEIEELRREALEDDDSPSDLDIPAGDTGSDDEFAEIIDARESALEAALPAGDRVVTLGDTVYYGNKLGQVSPAIVTHVYDDLEPLTGTPSHVDLQVFERERVWNAVRVERANLLEDGSLNGWMLKA